MSVSVHFYKNKSENIVANKELESIKNVDIVFRDETNISNPSIILSEKIDCNYAHISEFGRYYYVTVSTMTGGRFKYDFVCDPLMSLKNQIKDIVCTVLRNESLSNAYLHDSGYQTLAYKKYVTKKFPSGLNDDTMILHCIGD